MYPKMFAVVLLAVVGCAAAVSVPQYHDLQQEGVQHRKPHIPILKQDYQQSKEGYQFSYETGNGIHVQESGHIKNLGDEKHETLVQRGSVTYHDEHGRPITLTYVADENGFQPQGAHLPTPPPVPYAHQKLQQQEQQQQQQQLQYQGYVASQEQELQQNVGVQQEVDQQEYGY